MTAREVALSDVLERVERPISVSASETYHFMGVRSFGVGAFDAGERHGSETRYTSLRVVRDGDFVYPKLMAWEGAFAVVPPEFDGYVVSPEFCIFGSGDDLDIGYLGHLFRWPTMWERIAGASIGTNVRRRRLYPEDFLSKAIRLPPVDEQRRIVAFLDGVLAGRARILELSGRAASLAGALHRSWINHFAEGLGKPSLGLADVLAEEPRNGWSVRCDNAEDGVSVLGLGAVRGFRFNASAIKTTSEIVDPDAHYWLRPGDLLISRSNTPALVGHAAIYEGNPAPCIFPDLLMRARIDESRADAEFVLLWLQSDPVRSHLIGRAKGTSPTMVKIGKGDVLAIPFPELDVEGQRLAVRHLSALGNSLDRLTASIAARVSRLVALEASVLRECFSAG